MVVVLAWPLFCGAAGDFMSDGLGPEELNARLKTAHPPVIVDLRKPWEFSIAHIPGAINIQVADLERGIDGLEGDTDLVIYCMYGTRTREAEPILMDAGITGFRHLEGAFSAWIRRDLPIEKGSSSAAARSRLAPR